METEFIYETDLSAFAQAAAAGVQVQVPVSVGDGEEVHHEVTEGEMQVHSEEVATTQHIMTEAEAAEMDATAAAVAGIPVATSELQLQDGQIITETTVTSDDTGDLIVGMSAADAEVGALLSADQIPIMTAGSHIAQPDIEISPEDELRSNERLDRSSPDLWPQNLSSAAQHILAKNSLKTGESEQPLGIWAQGLDPEDINLLHQFGSLTSSSLVEEVKKLQNIAYQLGLEESKEMTRGKLLHVLDEEEATAKANVNQISHSHNMWQ
ncbi:Protein lin-52 [Orchesella cincta]|uniref:Protein lin-52 n=1 Tax=Orchesella cincta TaxID=48709 RepID=A0A1D2NI55_ORCCI|nr:Protein lin-52 [Orchesella cincta]